MGVAQGAQPEVPPLPVVEDGTEDGRGVESGEAKPIYRPVGADQGGGVQVSYDSVVLYRKVPHVPPHSRLDLSVPLPWVIPRFGSVIRPPERDQLTQRL